MWVIITEVLVMITQDDYASFIGWTKSSTAWVMTFIFVIISIAVVGVTSMRKNNR